MKKNQKNGRGIVYLVSNPCFHEWVKVGMVTPKKVAKFGEKGALEDRLKDLSRTNVPQPFDLHYAVALEDAGRAERRIHNAYNGVRDNGREFFKIDPASVRVMMEMVKAEFGGEEVKLNEETYVAKEERASFHEAQRQADKTRTSQQQRRAGFQFSALDIPVGAELVFVDDESITAEVIDNNRVRYEDEEMSLSAAADAVRQKLGKDTDWKVAGPRHWKYKGETIDERRGRMEGEADD